MMRPVLYSKHKIGLQCSALSLQRSVKLRIATSVNASDGELSSEQEVEQDQAEAMVSAMSSLELRAPLHTRSGRARQRCRHFDEQL